MGFFDDFWTGFKAPFEFVYDKGIKPSFNMFDKVTGAAGNIVGAAGNIAQGAGNAAMGIGDFLSGNTNIILYAFLGLAGLVVLPKLIEKIL